MLVGVVGGVVVPAAPEHAQPGASEDADGVWVVAAALAGALVDVGGPGVVVAAAVGEHAGGAAQAFVAGVAEGGLLAFAGFDGDGALAGVGDQAFGAGVAVAAVADLGDQLGVGERAAGAGEAGPEELAVGVAAEAVGDVAVERGDLGDRGGAARRPGPARCRGGLRLRGRRVAPRGPGPDVRAARGGACGPSSDGGPGSRPAAGGPGGWRRGARGSAPGRPARSARPRSAKRSRAPGQLRSSSAHSRLEAATLSSTRSSRARVMARSARVSLVVQDDQPEAVVVGTRQLGQHEGVEGVALAGRRPVAIAGRLHLVGMDRQQRQPGCQQPLGQDAVGALHRHPLHVVASQQADQLGQAGVVVAGPCAAPAAGPARRPRTPRAARWPSRSRHSPASVPLSDRWPPGRPRSTLRSAHRPALYWRDALSPIRVPPTAGRGWSQHRPCKRQANEALSRRWSTKRYPAHSAQRAGQQPEVAL